MYIYSGSFSHNGKDSDWEVIQKMEKFSELTNKVGEKFRKDNQFYANYTELNDTKIFADGTTFSNILYGNVTNISIDLQQAFYLIMSHGYLEATEKDSDAIDSLFANNTEECCNAKVVLSKENVYDKGNCILGTFEDWLKYRSFLLGLFPGSYTSFYQECERYYENLVFSDDYKKESQQVITTHSAQICHTLYCMNHWMLKELKEYKGSRIDFPLIFARKYNIENASFEGNGDTKHNYLTMNFNNGKKVCEAHFKYNSINGEKRYNDIRDCCRVYFAMPTTDEQYIYIGAIINHTKQSH